MKKINLLIPVAGAAQRFLDEGFTMPKPLIMVKDKNMINLAMESIKWDNCNLIFVVRKDHIHSFSIDEILCQKFGQNIRIVTTDGITRGTLCTCLLAEKHINNDNPLVIYTPDVHFKNTWDPYAVDPELDGQILTFKANSPAHSYVRTDKETKHAIQTAEKVVLSQNAAVGVYHYGKGKDFIKSAKEMVELEMTDGPNKEFYVCPIYNLLIKEGKKIGIHEVEKMHVLGTPKELRFYIDNVAPKFGERKIALAADHSGFQAKEEMREILESFGVDYIDFGTLVNKGCDYADYTKQAVDAVKNNHCDFAFGFCRTGQGVNITANKNHGIRSALIFDDYTAEHSVRHNCANFFTIPSKYVNKEQMKNIVKILMQAEFDGGRHMTRLSKAEN